MQTFKELNLDPAIQQAVTDLGYETPSAIQKDALPILLGEATDFIGLAATGTGKTAAFSIPLLTKIDSATKAVQGLVLCPTRELALQVTTQINLLGKHKNIKAVAIYGGASYGDQIHGLKSGAAIVVGTPGRVIDHLERGTLKLSQVATLVLDEADEMISMGFKEDLEKIIASTNRETCKTWLFSATMSPGVRKVADQYLNNPQQVHVNKKTMLSATVEQIYYMTHEGEKPQVLCKLIDAAEDFYGLVFCQTKSLVTDLTHFLTAHGYKVDSLHGDKDQNARERTLRAFRERKIKVLICTDVASRGIDVKDVTHVVNYSLPRELDNYVHRIGRTARSGKTGFALSLVTNSHRVLVGRIEQMTKSKMVLGKVPSRSDISRKKIATYLTKFLEQTDFSKTQELLDSPWKEALAKMSAEEISARFLALSFPEIADQSLTEKIATMPGQPERSEGRERSRDRDRSERRDRDRSGGGRRRERSRDGERSAGRSFERRERSDSFSGERRERPRFDRPKFDGPKFERPADDSSSIKPRFRRDRERSSEERAPSFSDRPSRRPSPSAERSGERRPGRSDRFGKSFEKKERPRRSTGSGFRVDF